MDMTVYLSEALREGLECELCDCPIEKGNACITLQRGSDLDDDTSFYHINCCVQFSRCLRKIPVLADGLAHKDGTYIH